MPATASLRAIQIMYVCQFTITKHQQDLLRAEFSISGTVEVLNLEELDNGATMIKVLVPTSYDLSHWIIERVTARINGILSLA